MVYSREYGNKDTIKVRLQKQDFFKIEKTGKKLAQEANFDNIHVKFFKVWINFSKIAENRKTKKTAGKPGKCAKNMNKIFFRSYRYEKTLKI